MSTPSGGECHKLNATNCGGGIMSKSRKGCLVPFFIGPLGNEEENFVWRCRSIRNPDRDRRQLSKLTSSQARMT
jgi:hypothetical protein